MCLWAHYCCIAEAIFQKKSMHITIDTSDIKTIRIRIIYLSLYHGGYNDIKTNLCVCFDMIETDVSSSDCNINQQIYYRGYNYKPHETATKILNYKICKVSLFCYFCLITIKVLKSTSAELRSASHLLWFCTAGFIFEHVSDVSWNCRASSVI